MINGRYQTDITIAINKTLLDREQITAAVKNSLINLKFNRPQPSREEQW